jgi:hypothetical protein
VVSATPDANRGWCGHPQVLLWVVSHPQQQQRFIIIIFYLRVEELKHKNKKIKKKNKNKKLVFLGKRCLLLKE